jgi:GT2 family glycosyltransferase
MTTEAVAVIIVNYNGGRHLPRCLEALGRQTVGDFSVIVIDNASTDGSADRVAECHPHVTLVRASQNLGFAGGNNLGLKHAGRMRWIALLNPDAFPQPDWLSRLLAAARAHPDYSFFGCRMRLAEAPALLDGTGDLYHVSGAAWRRDHGVPVARGAAVPEEIFGPCAAAALYSGAALEEVGGFDEGYFCYYDDVDLAFRLRLRGHRCLYVPDAVVDHVGSGSAGLRSDFATYHGHRNLVWTYAKNMPAPLLTCFLPLHLLVNLAGIGIGAARGQLGVLLRAKRDALRGLPAALRKRREIQATRVVGVRALLDAMSIRPPRWW